MLQGRFLLWRLAGDGQRGALGPRPQVLKLHCEPAMEGGHKVIVRAPERVHCLASGVDGSDGCPGSQLEHQEPTSPPGSLGAYLCCRRCLHAILCPNGPLSLQPLDAPLFVPW